MIRPEASFITNCAVIVLSVATLGAQAAVEKPITEGDCKTFFEKMRKASTAESSETVLSVFDLEAMVRRGVGEIDAKTLANLVQGIRDGSKGPTSVFGSIAVAGRSGELRLLRTRKRGGTLRPLIRVVTDLGFNYVEPALVRTEHGQVIAHDLFVFSQGEDLSTVFGRVVGAKLAWNRKSTLNKLWHGKPAYFRHFDKIQKAQALTAAGKLADAMALYEKLPESLDSEPSILIHRLRLALAIDDAKKLEATIALVREHHPNKASADYLSVDWLAAKKEFEKACACFARINQAVGGDPYLVMRQGHIRLSQGKTDMARRLFARALKAEPSLDDAQFGLLAVSVAQNDHSETLEILKRLTERRYDFSDMKGDQAYASFVETEEYQAFVAWLAKR